MSLEKAGEHLPESSEEELAVSEGESRPYWEYVLAPISRDLSLPRKPRYEWATRLACLFIIHEGINTFPADPFFFFQKYHIALNTYSRLARASGLKNVAEIIESTGSKDGLTVYKHGKIAVSYNDTESNAGRVFFTLFHEIAHIVLGHPFDFACTRLSRGGDDEVSVLENEADCFARNVLAPVLLVSEFRSRRRADIWNMFHMTNSAWETRIDFLRRDKSNTNPALLMIVRKQLSTFMYGATCLKCEASFIGHKGLHYCPICGSKTVKWGLGSMVYQDGYEVDDQGRAKICPRCGNEETQTDGEYCKICGQILTNRCCDEACGLPAHGNARFCTYCGCKSTFFKDNLLDDWETAKAKMDAKTAAAPSGMELPF